MSENKTGKYFKYAIGEILLVMIGILLALQVNNWNERRKERILEKDLLYQFQNEISEDTIRLNSEAKLFNNIIKHSNLLKEHLNSNLPHKKSIDSSFAIVSMINVFEANYLTYNKAKEIGMNIFKNDSIRLILSRYYDHSLFLKKVENYYEVDKYFRTTIYPKYFKEYRYGQRAVPVDYELLKQSNEFRIALDYVINDAFYFEDWSQHRKREAIWLLNNISKELE